MKASVMVKKLNEIIDKHGDLEIVGGNILDETSPSKVIVLDVKGMEYDHHNRIDIEGIFIG